MNATLALAVDLGGTKLEAALVDETGTVLAESRFRRPTGRDIDPQRLHTALAGALGDAMAALPAGARLGGVGIGAAGPVEAIAGTIHPVNMPGVHGFALRDAVGAILAAGGHGDLSVALGHDGGCFALAEAWIGATRAARASLSMVVSTGIGAGFVIDGRPLTGATGNAGHLGQVSWAGATLEEIASGPASVAWARSQGWEGRTGEDLASAAGGGHPIARAAVERSAGAVGAALADAATLLDLDLIAIGGGFSRVSPDYVELVAAALHSAAVLPYAQRTRVTRSALADTGPLVGAAALILKR